MRELPGCVCLCLRPCAVSHAIPLPRLTLHKHVTLMSVSDGYFLPPPPPPPSPAHTVNITFIFILGVWHRYRSETVAGDLSLFSIMCSHNCMNKKKRSVLHMEAEGVFKQSKTKKLIICNAGYCDSWGQVEDQGGLPRLSPDQDEQQEA